MAAPDPDRLTDLGKRLDEIQAKQAGARRAPQSQSGNATRVAAELVGGLFVGGAIGWGTDHIFHTAPWGMVVFFILGAAAGIRGVMRTAQKINAASAEDVEEK